MVKQHIIELNGKRYDATTGQMITSSPVPPTPQPAAPKPRPHVSRKGVDGFGMAHHKTQKSKTLMRGSVQKPEAPKKIQGLSSGQGKDLASARHAKPGSPAKLNKAMQIAQSSLIRRFNKDNTTPLDDTKLNDKPAKVARVQAVATATAVVVDPLSRGLAQATSHQEAKTKRPHRHARVARRLRLSPKFLSGASLGLALLLIGGFFAWMNVANISMRLASTRSGVNGSLPAYQPSGFSLNGGIGYKPGQISFTYKSNSDERNFKIIQSTSSWNSETLAHNVFGDATCKGRCQIVPDRGKTIYLYEGSNATWVDGGIWYKIEGDSKLNSDQLLNIAASL